MQDILQWHCGKLAQGLSEDPQLQGPCLHLDPGHPARHRRPTLLLVDVGFGHRVYHPKPLDDTLLLPLCSLLLVCFPINASRLSKIFREHFTTDMRDKELSYWTCRGENTAGFFVAEVDGEIAGTVCYVIEEDGEMEMRCLSTVITFYGLFLLMLKV